MISTNQIIPVNFNQDIKLKDSVDYKIAFIWGKATNSFFNITETNNKLNIITVVHGKQFNYLSEDIKQFKTLTHELNQLLIIKIILH